MRVMRGGQMKEYITGYNRVHEMISRLQPTDEQSDNLIQGFGNDYYDSAGSIKSRPGIPIHQRVSFCLDCVPIFIYFTLCMDKLVIYKL